MARAVCATLVVVASSCTGAEETDDVSPNAGPAAVRLVSTGGEVFAWEQRIEGTGACDAVTALVDGAEVDAGVELRDGTFAFTVPIDTGKQEVAARCSTPEGEVDTEPIVLDGRLTARPVARIGVRVQARAVELDGSRSEPSEPDRARLTSFTWQPARTVGGPPPEPLRTADGGVFTSAAGRRLTLASPSTDGEYSVTLTVEDAEGRTDQSTTYFVVEGGRARSVDLMTEHPAWIDRAIMYAPVHELWGGGAASVQRRLPYLKELGVDALWLWPPVERRVRGETYQIADYFSLDEEWGTKREFRRLVDRAHELGLRILIDFVPNHTSEGHRYYRTAQRDGPGSHYWDFYDRTPDGEVTSYTEIFHHFLPNLNYDNPQVRRMMTEAFSYWIRTFDVDGFRVDAAWGIERRAPEYWPEWRTELKRIKPDLLLLAEATAREAYYFRNGFDVGYDWTDHPGRWPWGGLWDFPQEMQGLVTPALTNSGNGFPRDAIVLRFLNNNDTGIRFEEQHGVELTRVASAMEFLVPGLPLIWAGDEIGASYQPYGPLEKIPWTDRAGLRPWYDSLIGLRRRFPALSSREMAMLRSDVGSVVAFVRPAVAGGSPVLVLLNFWKAGKPTIDPDPALDEVLGAGELEDALTGDRVAFKPGKPIAMPAYSVRVLVPEGAEA